MWNYQPNRRGDIKISCRDNTLKDNKFVHQTTKQWPIGGKIKSRCPLGMLKVNNLRHSYLNVMKLGNYGPKGECLNDNH